MSSEHILSVYSVINYLKQKIDNSPNSPKIPLGRIVNGPNSPDPGKKILPDRKFQCVN